MCKSRSLVLGALALGLASCSDAGDDENSPVQTDDEAQQIQDATTGLVDGSLGRVIYHYDPNVLTRAEIDLPLPPDFSETVFAVKFLPSSMTGNIGFGGCSYGAPNDATDCTAHREVGLALALLERPISHYREQLENSEFADTIEDPANLAEAEGFAVSRQSGSTGTVLRYVFVPVEDRTLLAVERTQDDIVESADALAAVRDSLTF